MIKRLGGLRPKPPHPVRASEAPWKTQALGQLRAVSSALHSSQKANMFRAHPRESRLRDLDYLVEGFGKMDLGCLRGELVGHNSGGRR